MDHFIDSFSKKLAPTMSRRGMLAITLQTLSAAVLANTAIMRVWGASTILTNIVCQRCNLNSRKCGYQCEQGDAVALYSEAQSYSPYVILQNLLVQRGFIGGAPDVLEVINTDDTISSVLGTNYTTAASAAQTARLSFTKAVTGVNAYATLLLNGNPTFGYFVSSDGRIQQVLPPYQLDVASNGAAANPKHGGGTSTCEAQCLLECNVGVLNCGLLATQICLSTVRFGPEIPLLCELLVYAMCTQAGTNFCNLLCPLVTCDNPANQLCGGIHCLACQECGSDGICTAKTCPPGYSCSLVTGSCTCSTDLCGLTCCPPGQTCSNGACACPSGLTLCGSTCCAADETCSNGACVTTTGCPPGQTQCGTTCCSAGQTCSNGTCTTGCPSGETPCGSTCCPAGQICSNGTCSTCPSGETPCGSTCCVPGANCCAGSCCQGACCSNGGCCVGDTTCCGYYCCPSGTSCCSTSPVVCC